MSSCVAAKLAHCIHFFNLVKMVPNKSLRNGGITVMSGWWYRVDKHPEGPSGGASRACKSWGVVEFVMTISGGYWALLSAVISWRIKMQDGTGLFIRIFEMLSVKVFNLSFFLACMILLTILSFMVLPPGNLLMVVIILASAFHLSCKFFSWHNCNRFHVAWISCPIDWCLDSLTSEIFQLHAGAHVLITRPMKFDSWLVFVQVVISL